MSRQQTQRLASVLITLTAVLVFVPVIVVIVYLIWQGIGAISWEFLTQPPRNGMTEGGIWPAILGTLILTMGTALVSMPFSIATAIYLAEYAGDNRLTRTIRMAIVNLAGIPSIVYGLFGLGAFVLAAGFGTSILAGSLTLGIMTMPVVISTAEEAINSVPQQFRTVSLSLGASKWQTIWHQVLPHALPGIITGMILGLSRAAGETAPILFTVAAFYVPTLPTSIFDQTMALPYHLYVIATQVPGMPLKIQYGTALVLLLITLTMTLIATVVRTAVRRRRDW
ncbi:MAG: phosphate ABC transporter permease PstA [Anaerolineae bacterium]|nr:phosphate ABC transporter permease PstA [Anaerolineae bacterium]MCB0247594.1 phosphate ABC transporter permease PstA [Anaerolineae bacterium]MCB9132593.1 phosphate ABC transporter permease PstA [Anaerolineales bacterium]MCB9141706.1 phosphate ABC transporter permease PstA [Anaerolineales bacterium]MCO5244720.1 phosphate ABC transporter permease PstA [Anaerolineae bacterium]